MVLSSVVAGQPFFYSNCPEPSEPLEVAGDVKEIR